MQMINDDVVEEYAMGLEHEAVRRRCTFHEGVEFYVRKANLQVPEDTEVYFGG